jgi:hypothetical protein
MEDGPSQPSSLRSPRPRIWRVAQIARSFQSIPIKMKSPTSVRNVTLMNRDRKEHVARRERVHECLAPSEAPGVTHSGEKTFRLKMQTARDASGAGIRGGLRRSPLMGWSGSDQTEKNSVRAFVFRLALELGHCSMQSACLKRAINGSRQPYCMSTRRRATFADFTQKTQRSSRSAKTPPLRRSRTPR